MTLKAKEIEREESLQKEKIGQLKVVEKAPELIEEKPIKQKEEEEKGLFRVPASVSEEEPMIDEPSSKRRTEEKAITK